MEHRRADAGQADGMVRVSAHDLDQVVRRILAAGIVLSRMHAGGEASCDDIGAAADALDGAIVVIRSVTLGQRAEGPG